MPRTLVIANRGEIAIRIARTARTLGWHTLMVAAQDETHAAHARAGDGLIELPQSGPAAYLDGATILARSVEAGATAVHPGYGFLSERADFAKSCAAAGLVFVGPSPETLDELGDKARARALARHVGVPVIPGSQTLESARMAAEFFETLDGAPMVLKAVHGGGGRGMRIVETMRDIDAAFRHCTAEAQAAFGSGALYAEQFLQSVRHVEVQIVGDGHEVVHLGERDCSLQRRNQKLLELAPAPNLPQSTRDALYGAALSLARATEYAGLGTVEFLIDTNDKTSFYFIEANPRIQVEHTISEEITGLDLVELQLRIAQGERLNALGLDAAPPRRGAALQARINAEILSPEGNLSPANGPITRFDMAGGPGVRVDTCGHTGAQVSGLYDTLLAKLILREPGGDLTRLLSRMTRALRETQISGIATNAPLLAALALRPELAQWSVDTGFVDRVLPKLLAEAASEPHENPSDDNATPTTSDYVVLPEGHMGARAPMQALVHSVLVEVGDIVQAGDEIALLEAMKMQHAVVAPCGGRVSAVHIVAGKIAAKNDVLIVLEPLGDSDKSLATREAPDPALIRPDLGVLQERLAFTLDENRPKAVARRRERGQMTTREIVAQLVEGGPFQEYGQLVIAGQRRKLGVEALIEASPADGIVTGVGTVNGTSFQSRNKVAILAYDSTVMAGTQGAFGHIKTDRMFRVAHEQGLATIFYTEGGGGRPNDDDFAHIVHSALDITTFSEFARLKGWGPKITVNSGFCFAGNAALFGAGDIKIATRNSWIGLGGPAMIEAGGLGRFSPREIGPAPLQAENGLVDILCEDDAEATATARKVLSYFQGEMPGFSAPDPRHLRHVIPEDRKRVYDIRAVIAALVDDDSFTELGARHAPGLVSGLARIEGRAVGMIANNPKHLGGALDAAASSKAARFLRLCDKFGLPVVSLCDTPGFMVGPESEAQGGVASACDMIGAGAELNVPLLFIVLRKGYGIGAQAMAGGSFATPAFTIAWPTGEFGAMGLEGAVQLGYKKELDAQSDETAKQALYEKLVARMYAQGKAINVASFDEIDAVIDPAETRDWIRAGLDMAKTRF